MRSATGAIKTLITTTRRYNVTAIITVADWIIGKVTMINRKIKRMGSACRRIPLISRLRGYTTTSASPLVYLQLVCSALCFLTHYVRLPAWNSTGTISDSVYISAKIASLNRTGNTSISPGSWVID
jgi:hypothetical protein